jgi:hypothetical protein
MTVKVKTNTGERQYSSIAMYLYPDGIKNHCLAE